LDVKKHDLLIIKMGDNPTTGWRWKIKEESSLFEIVSNEWIPARSQAGMVGTGGIRELRVKIRGEGKDFIKLVYSYPWQFEGFEKHVDQREPLTYYCYTINLTSPQSTEL